MFQAKGTVIEKSLRQKCAEKIHETANRPGWLPQNE